MHQNKLGRPSDVGLREEKCVKISVKRKEYLGNVGVDRSIVFFLRERERERERPSRCVLSNRCNILCTVHIKCERNGIPLSNIFTVP